MRSKREIRDQLRDLGLQQGHCAVVHSSFRSIGAVEGGPRAVIEALAEVLLPTGALLFPNLYIPHGFTVDDPPHFDLKGAHVGNLGILPEVFKFEYAEHFSIHPTHSMMGVGEMAQDVLADHELAGVPCGTGTPWAKNGQAGGKVLLIGVDQRVNTTYHSAEERIEEPYQLTSEVIAGTVIWDGQEMLVPSRLHVWEYHPDFNILNDELESTGHLARGHVGDAETSCVDAEGFINLALQKMQCNRWYFMDVASNVQAD